MAQRDGGGAGGTDMTPALGLLTLAVTTASVYVFLWMLVP